MIRLLMLIEHKALLDTFNELFDLSGDIRVEAAVSSAEECLAHLSADTEDRFHGLLLDTAMARELRTLVEHTGEVLLQRPILALCPKNTPAYLRDALSWGNTTFLEKDGEPARLLETIRSAVSDYRRQPNGV